MLAIALLSMQKKVDSLKAGTFDDETNIIFAGKFQARLHIGWSSHIDGVYSSVSQLTRHRLRSKWGAGGVQEVCVHKLARLWLANTISLGSSFTVEIGYSIQSLRASLIEGFL
jgi:hypothetical protein